LIHSTTLANHQIVRNAFPVLQDTVYLNVGTYGVMPQPALEHLLEVLREFEQRGVASAGGLGREVREARDKVAGLLGCGPDQITFTGNATDGTNLVLSGLPWEPEDEIITTDEEHESIIHPLLHLQQCAGIRMRRISVSPDPDVMLERLEAVISSRTKLVAFSHVTCETGTRPPAQAICEWAAQKGVLSLVDGAQSLGVFATSVPDLACDFYTSNGHKWLSGPKGTGIFYASPDGLLTLCPAHVGAGSLERADVADGTAELWQTGRRFEFGTRASALLAGLGASLDWLESLGWASIEQHIARMSGYLKARILERPYLQLLTPTSFAESSGLTTFSMEGWQAGEVSSLLRQQARIHARVIPHYNAIRISTPCFCSE
jgi:selenocysteine lyase/cysteine desulfurase